jgi:hypothetical protein
MANSGRSARAHFAKPNRFIRHFDVAQDHIDPNVRLLQDGHGFIDIGSLKHAIAAVP